MTEDKNENQENNEQRNEITEYYEGVKQLEIQGYETGIRKARTALFITAAIVLISELISAAASGLELTPLFWGIVLFEAGIFVGLAFWTRVKPYAAVITGLVIFILLWVLAAVLSDFEGIFKGIIFKVIIIVTLINALAPARAWEEAKKNK
jgi:hypothetical protein